MIRTLGCATSPDRSGSPSVPPIGSSAIWSTAVTCPASEGGDEITMRCKRTDRFTIRLSGIGRSPICSRSWSRG